MDEEKRENNKQKKIKKDEEGRENSSLPSLSPLNDELALKFL